MKISDLTEARRNADHPSQQRDRIPGKGQKPLVQLLTPYLDMDDVYVSFTELPKLGINPQSTFISTPNGIYAYPLKLMKEDIIRHNKEAFPLGSHRPWINIFKVKKELTNVKTYSNADLERDLAKFNIDKTKNNSLMSIISKDKPFKILMKTTDIFTHEKPNKWARLLYDMGHEGFVDPGKGWIHPDEPIQAVIFRLANIELLERINLKTLLDNYYVYDKTQRNPNRKNLQVQKQIKNARGNVDKLFDIGIENINNFKVFGELIPQEVIKKILKHYLIDVNVISINVVKFASKETILELLNDTSIRWDRVRNIHDVLINMTQDDTDVHKLVHDYIQG